MIADTLRLYFRYLGLSVRAQMQYRASFIMMSLGHGLVTGIEFLGLAVLFSRFGSLRGWTLPEVALLYGLVNMTFAIADATARGFDICWQIIRNGDFDRLLLRPRSTAFQLAGQELVLRRVGRFVQGCAVFLWAASTLHLAWTPVRLAFIASTIAGGVCIFAGFYVLQATLSFWTIETIEIGNILTHGGVETAQYPLTIYRPWFRTFFTTIAPLAFISYFPGLLLLGRSAQAGLPALVLWCAPLVGPLFLLLCLRLWRFGERHYLSTGS
jgi:ABC-2 type transport system permease protein